MGESAVSHKHTRKDFPLLVQLFHHQLDAIHFNFAWIQQYVPGVLLAT
jgi:hypothetical protein